MISYGYYPALYLPLASLDYLDHLADFGLCTGCGCKGYKSVKELTDCANRMWAELFFHRVGEEFTFKSIGQTAGVVDLHGNFLCGLGITLLLGKTLYRASQT
jgi:hypothetical protein